MTIRRTNLLIALLLLSATLCFASGKDERRQHGSHVHGIGYMNLAVDGNDVYIELENPSANIIGFEHKPSSDEERHAVHEAVKRLEDGQNLFIFSKQANCSLISVTVSSPVLAQDHDEEHQHAEAHSEFVAEYQFSCNHPEKIKFFETKLFSVFPGIEELKAQVLSKTGQTGAELTHKNYRMQL